MAALATMVFANGCSRRPTLPVLGNVPDFALTAQNGKTFHGSALRGHVWIADFIYTTCPGPCPLMSKRMKRIADRTGDRVRLVSFSVDPGHDTPEVLAAYAKKFGAPSDRWTFLTGDPTELQNLDRDVFKLGDMTNALDHSTRFVLMDRNSRIRAYYRMSDEGMIERVVKDAQELEREGD